MPCSAATKKFTTIYGTPTCHTDSALQMHSSLVPRPPPLLVWSGRAVSVLPFPCIILNTNRRTKTGEPRKRGYMHSTDSDRPHLPWRVSSNPQHAFSMHINMHYTPMQHYPPHCLQQPSYAHKQQKLGIVGKMAQDVGTVWKYCGVIAIQFGWFGKGFIPTCACFRSDLWLCN